MISKIVAVFVAIFGLFVVLANVVAGGWTGWTVAILLAIGFAALVWGFWSQRFSGLIVGGILLLVLLPCGAVTNASRARDNYLAWQAERQEVEEVAEAQECASHNEFGRALLPSSEWPECNYAQPDAPAPPTPVPQQPTAPPTTGSGDDTGGGSGGTINTSSCAQARDLGPWAPTASGEGTTFEVTASDQGASNLSSAGVVLALWWPGNSGQPWGTQEITTFVPRGLSVTVIAGAGRGWDYEANCPTSLIQAEMDAHMSARVNDTAYHGFILVEQLISSGLMEVRFDRRAGNAGITPSTAAQPTAPATASSSSSGGNSGFIGRDGDADGKSVGNAQFAYVIDCFEPVSGKCVVPVGETISGVKGALWKFGSTASALSDASSKSLTVFVVENGQLVQQ